MKNFTSSLVILSPSILGSGMNGLSVVDGMVTDNFIARLAPQ